MSFDFCEISKSKRALREWLAGRPIAEKLRMLDAMRACFVSIRAAKSPQTAVVREQPPDSGEK